MVLFIIFALVPALMFNVYALTQFWREGKRAGDSYPRRVARVVTFITARPRQTDEDMPRQPRESRGTAATPSGQAVVMFRPRDASPARQDVA